jgi:hypothetical protein
MQTQISQSYITWQFTLSHSMRTREMRYRTVYGLRFSQRTTILFTYRTLTPCGRCYLTKPLLGEATMALEIAVLTRLRVLRIRKSSLLRKGG